MPEESAPTTYHVVRPTGFAQTNPGEETSRAAAEEEARRRSRSAPGTWRVMASNKGLAVAKFKNGRKVV